MSDDQTVEIAPCPYCGHECEVIQRPTGLTFVGCTSLVLYCPYHLSGRFVTVAEAIAAHNALCADVQRGREDQRLRAKYNTLSAERRAQFVVDMMELLSGKDAGYVAWLEDQNQALEQERDGLRTEVDRLKTAIADLRYAFDDPVVVERIAAWSHKSWAGWYRWMAMKWHEVHQNTGESFRDRWKRQSETPYVKLSDSEQNSDRAEAKEVLNVLYEILPWPRFESKKGEDCEGHSIARADTGYGESSDSSGTKQ